MMLAVKRRSNQTAVEILGLLSTALAFATFFLYREVLSTPSVVLLALLGLSCGLSAFMIVDLLPAATRDRITDSEEEAELYRRRLRANTRNLIPAKTGEEAEEMFSCAHDDHELCESHNDESLAQSLEALALASAGVKGTGDIFADSLSMLDRDHE